MQGSPLAIVAAIGVAVVCIGLVIAVGWFVFSFLLGEHHALEFFELLNRESKEEKKEEDKSHFSAPTPNLRAIAEAEDFDTALTKHIVKEGLDAPKSSAARPFLPEASRMGTPPPPAVPPPDQPFPDATPRLGSRRSSDSRPPHLYDRPDDEDDDALADFLSDH